MKYNFSEIMNFDIYETTRVMFVLGKYNFFNNSVCDTLKGICIDEEESNAIVMDLGDEFGISNEVDNDYLSNSVDFNTFIDVIGVSSINGKWFCKTDLSVMNKKQKEVLNKYIKDPSPNGILVVVSNDWKQYKEYLKNRTLAYSKYSHIIQLTYPNKQALKSIVLQAFNDKGYEIENPAVDFFIMKMSHAYEDYPDEIDSICEMHQTKLAKYDASTNKKEQELNEIITAKDLKEYMKGVENFIVDDFIEELLKPMSSAKTNNKKVLRMMITLEDDIGAKDLVYQIIKKIDEYIELRILINSGYIPIGVNYFFNNIVKKFPEKDKEKYEKSNEWLFKKKVELASRTSLVDWEYMKIILTRAIENKKLSDDVIDHKCQKALYELATRSVISPDRINNIIGIDNVLKKQLYNIDRIKFDEKALNKIEDTIRMSEES